LYDIFEPESEDGDSEEVFFVIADIKNLLRMIIEFNFIGKCCAMLLVTHLVLSV
jgi:hypothetical protein